MDVHEYLGVLRRGIVLIVVGVLLGLTGGYIAQGMEKPTYSATSRELLTNKVPGDLSISQGRIASYVLVASSGLVLQPVIDQLGLDTSVDELAQRVSIVAPPNTLVIEITATAATAEEARDTANTISTVFAEVVADQLETTTGVAPITAPVPTPGASGNPNPVPSPTTTTLPDGTVVPIVVPTAPVRVVNLEQAALPAAPDASVGPLMLLVGGVLGLALGLLAASARQAIDRRIRTPRDIGAVTQVPVVGGVVADRRIRSAPLTARAGSRSSSAESFRALRAHVDHLRERDGRRVVVLTAAGRAQGSTTIAANLGIAMANTGSSVALVDADLRTPDLSVLFGLHSGPGLSGVLAGRVDLDDALRASGTSNLTVVPAGGAAVNAGELIATSRMRTVLAELARRFDAVIIDTPSIADASDAAVLGNLAGTTLLVVAQAATTRPHLDDALALLEAGGADPVGIVLNRTARPLAGRSPHPNSASRVAAAPLRLPAEAGSAPVVPMAPSAAPAAAPVLVAPAASSTKPAAAPEERRASHLADPIGATKPATAVPAAGKPTTSRKERTSRRVTQPAMTSAPQPTAVKPVANAEPVAERRRPPAVKPEPVADPARDDRDVTEIAHTLGSARELDSAFAALPIATADEQRAGSASPDFDDFEAKQIERPIVIKPDPVRVSRFAPDPAKTPPAAGAYKSAPAPVPGTHGKLPPAPVDRTVVDTVSVRVTRDEVEAAPARPPIRHILPSPTSSTIPPKEVEAARPPEPEPELVEARPRTGPVPVPPREAMPEVDENTRQAPVRLGTAVADDDPTAETPPPAEPETRAIPIAGSLLGEIGGLPRVEVRAARPTPVTDTAPNPERIAREAYELRARELERVAHERLMREQQRLAVDIREQLAHDKRELESVLDNRLEDTVLHPRA